MLISPVLAAAAVSAAAVLAAPGALPEAATPAPLTLERALDLAHQANARLPVAALEPQLATQRLHQAEAQRRVIWSADGELWLAPAGGYDPTVTDRGDERLQLVAEQTLYDGGGLRARVRQARAEVGGARARFRQQVADVDQQVREAFAALLAARREVATRDAALARLRHYLDQLEARAAAGQPLTADRLSTRVQLASDSAARVEAQDRAEQARTALDSALGLPLDADPVLAPLPPPQPPAWIGAAPSPAAEGSVAEDTAAEDTATARPPVEAESAARDGAEAPGSRPGESTAPVAPAGPPAPGPVSAPPEIAVARRDAEAAAAALAAARAERAPQVTLRADAGLWGADPFHVAGFGDRLQRDLGYSLSVGVHLPLFGSGGVDARIAEAELAAEQARRGVTEVRVQARLALEQARRAQVAAYRRYSLLAAAQPVARDARLDAESRYWGGAATSREVLDAFSAAVDAAVALDDAELAYHLADARRRRWAGADSAPTTRDLP